MKKLPLLLLLLLTFPLVQCSEPAEEKEVSDEELYEFQRFSMKPYDLPVTIMLPDETANIGASTKPEIEHEEDGFKWTLAVGPNFQMVIDDWGADREMVSDKKKELAGHSFLDIKYIINEPDFIMYEQVLKARGKQNAAKTVGVEHKTYHVYGQKVINGITYVFRSRDEGYERVIIDLMVKSIKSVKGA